MVKATTIKSGLSVGDFRRNLRVLEREVVRQMQAETSCCKVTLAQCHVLLELASSEQSLSGLASALDLDISTLSRTVDDMVRAGLVQRTTNLKDRRSFRLTLTADGNERVRTINSTCDRHYAALLDLFEPQERRQVVRIVQMLSRAMRQMRVAEETAPPSSCRCTTGGTPAHVAEAMPDER